MSTQQDTIYIVIATDNHYAILLAALLKSIEQNHKSGERIEFYIIDNGITPENIGKLKTILDPAAYGLHFCDMKKVLPKDMVLPVDGSALPFVAYMRMFAPYIIPAEAEKVLYLDVDMIVVTDISKLWHTDIGDYMVGCVQDHSAVVSCEWAGIRNYAQLGLSPDTKYFNSGLLHINAKAWRAANIPEQIIRCSEENKEYLSLADQYPLNVVFANKWFELDPRWNCKAILDINDPYIMHFIDIKPIYKSYNGSKFYQDTFYKYLNMTPWANYSPKSNYVRLWRKIYYKLIKTTSKLLNKTHT
ncbi:glycosyltransferase family 8 protein [Pedobacter sp. SYP-B3415]|uniref:glycosyltransferase family 8 protein n=1 Tax=Pedobacter sp. SYP-B3415 TaxID=2496641 RepID=UPI00101D43D4|nr:glycosyltransferase family 8 protein [Pedobacter sp. SYP-B3415]